jgi:Na+/glutamate symporter
MFVNFIAVPRFDVAVIGAWTRTREPWVPWRYSSRPRVSFLDRYNVPAPLIGSMRLGSLLSAGLSRCLTLPGYIGAMIVAAALRNLDDVTAHEVRTPSNSRSRAL